MLGVTTLSRLLAPATFIAELFAQQSRGVVGDAAQPLLHGLIALQIVLHRAIIDLCLRRGPLSLRRRFVFSLARLASAGLSLRVG